MTQPLADQIEQALTSGLVHPGNGDGPFLIPLPMFANTLPSEAARHFAEEAGLPHPNVAKLVAEALAHLIDGSTDEASPAT